jgi:hypothetical protein
MHSTPFHKQLDPTKQAGQIVNPIPKSDQEVYRFMNRPAQAGTVGEYARRKMDNHAGMPVSESEAFCSRIMR